MKWIGGKRHVLPLLLPLLPRDFLTRVYVEPFVGGGAMFFDTVPSLTNGTICHRKHRPVIADANKQLIITYTEVRDHLQDVIRYLGRLQDAYIDAPDRQAYYLAQRDKYNTYLHNPRGMPHAELAAFFLFFNRTGFNGLWRVNKAGKFNVPWGMYTKPKVMDVETLTSASLALQGAEICHADFAEIADALLVPPAFDRVANTFIYFDPPYDPISDTAHFAQYTGKGFDHNEQTRLRGVCESLALAGAKIMVSNSDTSFIRQLWSTVPEDRCLPGVEPVKWNIETIQAPRAVAAKGESRGKVSEVVIRNYEE